MQPTQEEFTDPILAEAFVYGGETGALMRSLDWSQTLCGPISGWPQSLRSAVSFCLQSGTPMIFCWGPKNVNFYNDAALAVVMRDRHPQAMGRTLIEVWPEIADLVSWIFALVKKTGRPVAFEDAKLLMNRNGRLVSAYFTFSFSPIRNEQCEVVGVLNTFVETTGRVLGERRLRTLRELAVRAADARSAEEACDGAIAALALNRSDVPFALIYLSDHQATSATLAGTLGISPGELAAPSTVPVLDGDGSSPWPLARVMRTRQAELVADLMDRFGAISETGRPVPRAALVLPAARTPPRAALVLPTPHSGKTPPPAFLIVGLNPYRPLDDEYRGFLELVAGAIGAGIANARAFQLTRERAERLAELDRAKTTFLSNISHEFRTPLTLILSPIDDLLSAANVSLAPSQREQLLSVRRNALRLLRLVNDLLTFARIEAGRMDAFFEPVDLASLTRELVSMFDSAATHAGLQITVDCPPLPEPIYVDRELWEKIVLNLLTNALKFTFEGEIAVSLRPRGDDVELAVRDTGVGIPADELSHVFERFYRVRGARVRTQEGAGIGLSLVRELARLHGGDVRVESVEGRGTTFTVEIPRGSDHLPQERVGAARPATRQPPESSTYVEEARRWVSAAAPQRMPAKPGPEQARPHILVAEDNADMRDYLERLLAERYTVVVARDGAAALAAARENVPDVVLSDVMMPNLDGLQLVSMLREDPRTHLVPIMLLSARAEEEAALDGLSRGADDYVVKPFSSREVLARIDTHLELARMRHEMADLKLKDDFMTIASHELVTPLTTLNLSFQRARDRLEKAGFAEATLLTRLGRAIARIEALVENLLTVAVVSRGELPLSLERCDLAQLCRQAAEEQAAATHREVTLELPAHPVEAIVDQDAIGHVLNNLLANALKFSAADRPVVLALRRADDEAIIAIRDEGPGIPAEELPKLFQRFYRVPGIAVQTGSKVGFGLGLYICKGIVQRHNGRIWAESTVGHGSIFSFALPLRT